MIERRGTDPAVAMLRELRRRVPDAELVSARQAPWASVTYSGVKLSMEVRSAEADAVDRLLLDLPEMEWRLPGHLMADVAGMAAADEAGTTCLRIEALVLERD